MKNINAALAIFFIISIFTACRYDKLRPLDSCDFVQDDTRMDGLLDETEDRKSVV